ncbi:unnamed protein product [Periconia digitata]|uniref:HAD-like protein n=1 Tax=Periconia digitata TaxID=1303443 RepID=A0A9W4UEP4_9PLEO|nr:unnamed protein product [Periconia digitata]
MDESVNLKLITHLLNVPPSRRVLSEVAVSASSRQIHFLLACPRSGSTLLMRVLAQAPNCDLASRVALKGNGLTDTDLILAYPDTVIAYQRTTEEESRNVTARDTPTFTALPLPIDFTVARPAFLIRDPVRVFDSWKQQGWTDFQTFLNCFQHLFSSLDEHLSLPHVLVYEKLVQNPAAEVSRLCDYWGLEYTANMTTISKAFPDFSINAERENGLNAIDPPTKLFDTVLSSSQVDSSITSHGTLSNQEMYDIEQQLGHLYLRCWKSEIKTIRTKLLQAKWFAFDLDDTLHEFRRASTTAIDAVLSAILSEIPETPQISFDNLKSAYSKVLASKTSSAFIDGKTSHEYREDRIRSTLVAFSIDFNSEQMSKWVSLYETSLIANLELKCGVVDLFTSLKSLGKNIAIITEGPQDSQERTIARLGLTGFVDFLATTGAFGVSKTEGLFTKVVEKLGPGSGSDFVMVGDNFERDVRPAREVGMYGVHYTEKMNFGAGDEVLRINTLKKLEFMLVQV